jgi:hypothetical protein
MASAMVKFPTIPTRRKARRTGVTGGAALVSHAYPPYIHHISRSSSTTRPTPPHPSSCPRVAVSWVTVKTKTRSKKSSRVVTDPATAAGESRRRPTGSRGIPPA